MADQARLEQEREAQELQDAKVDVFAGRLDAIRNGREKPIVKATEPKPEPVPPELVPPEPVMPLAVTKEPLKTPLLDRIRAAQAATSWKPTEPTPTQRALSELEKTTSGGNKGGNDIVAAVKTFQKAEEAAAEAAKLSKDSGRRLFRRGE